MVIVNLTLGNTIFSHFYMPYSNEFGEILPKINQHKIVLSKEIIEYYERCAVEAGYKDECFTFIQKIIQSKQSCQLVSGFGEDNIGNELIKTALYQPMSILIAEKEEIKSKKRVFKELNLVRCSDIINNPYCILNMYSIPITSLYVDEKKPVRFYVKWLKNYLKGEKEIIIRDNYMLTERGIEAFKKFYLPIIEKEARIVIHTDRDVEKEFIDEFDNSIYDDYLINIYKCERMHDRVIILNDIQIVIGRGIDFLDPEREVPRACFISVSKATIDAKDLERKQLR